MRERVRCWCLRQDGRMRPVLNQPSSVKACSVSWGLFQYSLKTEGPRTRSSPSFPSRPGWTWNKKEDQKSTGGIRISLLLSSSIKQIQHVCKIGLGMNITSVRVILGGKAQQLCITCLCRLIKGANCWQLCWKSGNKIVVGGNRRSTETDTFLQTFFSLSHEGWQKMLRDWWLFLWESSRTGLKIYYHVTLYSKIFIWTVLTW